MGQTMWVALVMAVAWSIDRRCAEATQIPRVMAVTESPFAAATSGASFSCLVSTKEENNTAAIQRYVRQGEDIATDTFDLPSGHVLQSISPEIQKVYLPVNENAPGTYTCRIFKNGQNHDVPITLLSGDRRFESKDGRSTLTVNAGERALLIFENVVSVLTTATIWQRLSDYEIIRSGGTSHLISSAETTDEDVYGCYINGLLDQARLGMLRLIVRACPEGKWMPPLCTGICDQCFNGGVCDDVTGECICAPGFIGPNCLQLCAVDRFGWDCEFQCGSAQPLARCVGSHMCMPDPYGCTCAAGYSGIYCTDECPVGMFGADCLQECHCSFGDCMAHSGECIEPLAECLSGWSGENCQIPDVCPAGYYGTECIEKCHCQDDEACDKETGYCTSEDGFCAPGFISSTGVNVENCQQFIGCHTQCTRTCHCSGGESDCIMDDTPATNGMCLSGMCDEAWTGTNCESGIIEQTSDRANPGQPFTVTCAAINPNLDTIEIVTSTYLRQSSPSSETNIPPNSGSNRFVSLHGMFYAYVKLSYPVSGIYQSDRLFCVHESGDGMAVGEVTLNFYVLPVLSSAPVLIDSGDSWVTILWQAWNSTLGDLGEGPVVSYSLYLKEGNNDWTMELSVPHTDNTTDYMWNITGLIKGSEYQISVTVSREGVGGEGERSTPLSVTVGTTLPPVTERMMTTSPTSNIQPEPNPMTSNATVIVFVFLCIILVFLMLVLALTFYIKRRSRTRRKKEFELSGYRAAEGVTFGENGIHSDAYVDEIETEVPLRVSDEQDSLPVKPVAAIKPIQSDKYPPIPMDDFQSYFWSSLEGGLLQKQWEAFPEEMTQACIVAKKEENKQRNRYRNILPYEHNRVILKDGDDPTDGYINASYIKGFSGAVTYIASQGPNTASVNDFWKMIWQEDVGKIVMVTNLFEEGKNKCYKYWPDLSEGVLMFGQINVSINSETPFQSCVQRQLTIVKGQNSRNVTHFHYVDWPDKNIPRNTFSVLRFLDMVKTTPTRASGPIAVHCSAGAGRSGVFLALDIQQDRLMNTMDVDIFNCVMEMRTQRPLMVQTLEQYIFVHRLIMEWLVCSKNTFVTKENLSVYNTKLHEVNPETGEPEMTTQFKILAQILPEPKVDPNAAGLKPENVEKNREPNIVPLNKFRPFLITEVDAPGSTNYINASFIDGVSSQSEFVTTQMPLPHTILDFWRLIHDYQIKTIVCLNNLDKKDETCQPYWGMGEPLVCNNLFRITTTAVQKKGEIVERTLALENMLSKTVLQVKQFQLKRWPNHEIKPPSMARFVLFVELVKEYLSETKAEGSLLVHCMNGVARSGLFCAVLSCLKQFDSLGGVDVVQTVKQLKQCQPLFVRTEEEFCLIYDLITLFVSPEACLEQAEMYANLPSGASTDQLDSEALYENLGYKSEGKRSLSNSNINHAESTA